MATKIKEPEDKLAFIIKVQYNFIIALSFEDGINFLKTLEHGKYFEDRYNQGIKKKELKDIFTLELTTENKIKEMQLNATLNGTEEN